MPSASRRTPVPGPPSCTTAPVTVSSWTRSSGSCCNRAGPWLRQAFNIVYRFQAKTRTSYGRAFVFAYPDDYHPADLLQRMPVLLYGSHPLHSRSASSPCWEVSGEQSQSVIRDKPLEHTRKRPCDPHFDPAKKSFHGRTEYQAGDCCEKEQHLECGDDILCIRTCRGWAGPTGT